MDNDPIPNIAEEPQGAKPLTENEIKVNNLLPLKMPKSQTKSIALRQFKLLGRTDRRKLQKLQSRNAFCHVNHLCVHCLQIVFLAWKNTCCDGNKA